MKRQVCGCVWVTIWVCIKVFRNKASLTCKGGGGRRRQLPPRREFPPLIFLFAVRIIQTSQQLAVLYCCSDLHVSSQSLTVGQASTKHQHTQNHTPSPSPYWAEMHLPATLSLVAFPICKLRS